MKRFYYIIILIILSECIHLNGQESTFQITLSDPNESYLYPRVINDGDNGIYVLYRALSTNNDYNVMITKLDTLGKVIWSKQFGDNHRNLNKEFYRTDYGLLLLLWRSEHDKWDDWHLMKIDINGNILEESFNGDENDNEIFYAVPTENNNYLVASDYWDIISNVAFSGLNDDLQVSDTKIYRLDNSIEVVRAGILTPNNKVLFCGWHKESKLDPLIISTDTYGNLNYMYDILFPGDCDLHNLIATNDNEYIAVGYTDGYGNGGYDILIIKFKENGNITWVKTIGGSGNDKAYDVHKKDDGSLLITGETNSENNNYDVFLINIDQDGNLLSGYTYGGEGDEHFGFLDLSQDNQLVIAASTTNIDNSFSEIYIVKTRKDGNSCCSKEIKTFSVETTSCIKQQLFPEKVNLNTDDIYYYVNHINKTPESNLMCYSPLKILGPTGQCKYSENVKYKTQPNVYGFYDWILPEDATISNNQNDTTIFVNFGKQEGYIYLKSKYCPDEIFDSLYVSLNGLLPNLGNDTTFCSLDLINLTPGNYFDSYLWQDGSTSPIYETNESGLYWVKVEDNDGCIGTDSINLQFIGTPEIDLGPDTAFIEGETYTLDAGPGFDSYLWNDNTTEETLVVSEEGKYWVTGYYSECISSDTIVLLHLNCNLYIPNAFTPNDDGINDEFFAIPNESISRFNMVIFNRWGQVLIKLDNIYKHWDGKYKGRKIQEGVYYWIATYECVGSPEEKKLQGSVTVIY